VLRWLRYVFWGGAAGLVAGLGAAFVLAVLDGHARGFSPGGCLAYGSALTLLLSHPAGLGGIVVGSTLGAAVGGIAFLVRHRRPVTSA
jgi:hypothetical protein